jgi:hypothetical protein
MVDIKGNAMSNYLDNNPSTDMLVHMYTPQINEAHERMKQFTT